MKLRRYSNRKLRGGANAFWLSPHNRRHFLDFVQGQLAPNQALSNHPCLYSLSVAELIEAGGSYPSSVALRGPNWLINVSLTTWTAGRGLLHPYEGSLPTAIMVEYPDHCWQPWKFA